MSPDSVTNDTDIRWAIRRSNTSDPSSSIVYSNGKIDRARHRLLPTIGKKLSNIEVGTEPGASLSDCGATVLEAAGSSLQAASTMGACKPNVGPGAGLALNIVGVVLAAKEVHEAGHDFRDAKINKQRVKREISEENKTLQPKNMISHQISEAEGSYSILPNNSISPLSSPSEISGSSSNAAKLHSANKDYKHAKENLFSSTGELTDACIDTAVGGMTFSHAISVEIASSALSGVGGILGLLTSLIPFKRSITEINRKRYKSKVVKRLQAESPPCTNKAADKLIKMHHEFLLKKRRAWFSISWSSTNVLRNIVVSVVGILGAVGLLATGMLPIFILIALGAGLYGGVIGMNMYLNWRERRDTRFLIDQFRSQLYSDGLESDKNSPVDKNKFLDDEIYKFINLYEAKMTETCLDYLLVLKHVATPGGDPDITEAILATGKNKQLIESYFGLIKTEWPNQPEKALKLMRYCREH